MKTKVILELAIVRKNLKNGAGKEFSTDNEH